MADNVNNELAHIERKLDTQHSQLKRQQTLSLVVGVVLLIIVVIYMSWIGGYIRQMTEPEDLSMIAADYVTENLPEARKAVAQEAKANLPKWLDQAVNEVINTGMPQARQYIEEESLRYLDQQLEKADTIVRQNIDDAFERHSDEIILNIRQLDTEEGQKEFEERLYKVLSESLNDENVQLEMQSYTLALEEISQRLDRITQVANMKGDTRDTASDQEMIMADLIAAIIEMGRRMDITEVSTKDLGEALNIGE